MYTVELVDMWKKDLEKIPKIPLLHSFTHK